MADFVRVLTKIILACTRILLWHQKTIIPWAIVQRYLHDSTFSVLIQYSCVTDGWTDGQTDRHDDG